MNAAGAVFDEQKTMEELDGFTVVTPVPIGGRRGTFGRYHLGYQLATGGMASIYLARMVGPGGFEKPVVLKRMHEHLRGQPEHVKMFCDEARVHARIVHPNVCPLLDFGQCDGRFYMALEYVQGVTLSRLLRALARQPRVMLTPQWHAIAFEIAVKVADALSAAHTLRDHQGELLGIVHRDVSPENILIGVDGSVRLLDFGVAKSRNQMHHTQTGTIMGKFSYMSPEQISGRATDERTDVWALGVCLWEMLAAKRLFGSKDIVETMRRIRRAPMRAPSTLRSGVQPMMDRVVMTALERNISRRWQTARVFSDALRGVIKCMNVQVSPTELGAFVQTYCHEEVSRQDGLLRALFDLEHENSTSGVTWDVILEESGSEIGKVGEPDSATLSGTERLVGTQASLPAAESKEAAEPVADLEVFSWRLRVQRWLDIGRERKGMVLAAIGALCAVMLVWVGGEISPRVIQAAAEPEAHTASVQPSEAREAPPLSREPQETVTVRRHPEPSLAEALGGEAGAVTPATRLEGEESGNPVAARASVQAEDGPEEEPSPGPAPPDANERPDESRAAPARVPRVRPAGFLNLVTLGGTARVSWRGRSLGTTPGRFRLPEGRHRIRLTSLEGSQRQVVRVNVRGGETTRQSVRF